MILTVLSIFISIVLGLLGIYIIALMIKFMLEELRKK